MGGEGSGRKPDPVKALMGTGKQSAVISPDFTIPDYSGVHKSLKDYKPADLILDAGQITHTPLVSNDIVNKSYVDSQITTHDHDSDYVNVTGDTMTGNLTIDGGDDLIFTFASAGSASIEFKEAGSVRGYIKGEGSGNYLELGYNASNPTFRCTSIGRMQMQDQIDMNNQLITNIGASGCDFTSGGGLTLTNELLITMSSAPTGTFTVQDANTSIVVANFRSNHTLTTDNSAQDGVGVQFSFGLPRDTDSAGSSEIAGVVECVMEDVTFATWDSKIEFQAVRNQVLTTFLTASGQNNDLQIDDNIVLSLGTGRDATIKYDATNLIIDPDAVGSGVCKVTGGFEVEVGSTFGAQAVTIDQDDADKAFIDYQGTSAANQTNNISTVNGDGAATTINRAGSNDGWLFVGMVKIEINGAEYWMPYYSAEAGSGC